MDTTDLVVAPDVGQIEQGDFRAISEAIQLLFTMILALQVTVAAISEQVDP